jgi:exodeoxyribonuclease V alpha subunit
MDFSNDQLKAIDYCTDTKRRVVAITGEAGTGKTTILKRAVSHLRDVRGRVVCLAAPTGRAARRITEASGLEATTIHKLLGFGKPEIDQQTGEPKTETRPSYTKDKPLPYDDVFVDEYMMVHEALHRDLLDALKPGARLLAFGDVGQLPPIEKWAVYERNGGVMQAPFERILKLPSSVTLDVVFRQQEGSGILKNAQRVRRGIAPIPTEDFAVDRTEYPLKNLREHVNGCSTDYKSIRNQVITPAKRGALGTHSLNAMLQAMYQSAADWALSLPRNKHEESHPISVHEGEKVVCMENTYDMRDFFDRYSRWVDEVTPVWESYIPAPESYMMLNGEIGIITEILEDGQLTIDVGDRLVHVPNSFRDYIPRYKRIITVDPRKRIDLAYAVTTHKMQGSECDAVCYILHNSMFFNINRNNIYTAITRAKERVHFITDSKSLNNGARLTAAQKAANMAKNKDGGFKIGDI